MDETEVTNFMYLEYLYWLERVYSADYPEVYRKALPDTLVWRSKLGYNEPYVEFYLRHPAYRDYPVVGVKVTLIDGSYHQVDSSDLAFEQAAAMSIESGLKKAESVLLEPVMRLQIVVPEAYFGAVQGNLLAKRGVITATHLHGAMRVIDANVPLAEMFGYSSDIRSTTAGRGTFTMEPLSYEKVPEQVASKLIF